MTELIDIKTRMRSKAPVEEPEVSVEQFFKDLLTEENLKDCTGAIVILLNQDQEPFYSHVAVSWGDILWHAHHLAKYATEDDYEDEDE